MLTILDFSKTLFKTIETVCCPDGSRHCAPWCSPLPISRLCAWLLSGMDDNIELMVVMMMAELQKRADRADQSVLFFLASANFWEKHAKNRQKHAKTSEKQALFWC